MEKTVIEIKTLEEIENVLSLFKETLASLHRSEEYRNVMARKFASSGIVFCLKNTDCVIIAFAAFYCNDEISRIAYLSMIAVNPENQGQGLGKILLKSIEEYSIDRRMEKMRLAVSKKNSNAIRFYESNGYKLVEEKEFFLYYQKDFIPRTL